MKKIEIEWLCENGHVHHNYPRMPYDAKLDKFAKRWLQDVVCTCGAQPISFSAFDQP